MRVHQFLIIEIIDIDPLLKSLILLIILNKVLEENINILFAILVFTDQDLSNDLERMFGGQNLVAYFVL